MASDDDDKIASCLHLLNSSKSDNDRFAALLMVAKVTNSMELTVTDRDSLLDAIGVQFLIRLLKSKSVPEGCPSNVYKVLSLNILSGLCTDPQRIVDSNLYKSLKTLNEIIVLNSQTEEEFQMADSCYDIYQVYIQTDVGIQQLIDGHVVPALCTVITSGFYGSDKATILLQTLLLKAGSSSWIGHHDVFMLLLEHVILKFDELQDENKFKLCKFLAEIIGTTPEDMKLTVLGKECMKRMIKTIRDIFTSKIGGSQREPALELVAMVTENLGVTCLLPPYASDSKLLLIVTHLGCIETRMILENTPVTQIGEKSNILCSCYQLLECIINHMTTAPSLMLDDQQVLQLHAAMTGAFNAVMLFLKELSEADTYECPMSVVIATLRVLGAWLAEETSALREKVYEILPFLIKICKTNFEENKKEPKKVSFHDMKTRDSESIAKNSDQPLDEDESCEMNIADKMADCDITKGDNQTEEIECDQGISSRLESEKHSGAKIDSGSNEVTSDASKKVTCRSCERDDRVDLIKFMLPGLCHLTAEDKPRQILLQSNMQELLERYFSWCWKCLQCDKYDTSLQGSMETLCNVFLNLAVTETNLAADDQSLHNVTLLIMEAVPLMDENSTTLKVSMITLGLMLLRQQEIVKDHFSKPVKSKFFTCVMLFIKGVHTCSEINQVKSLTVTETYQPVWEEIYQLWLLSLQALKSCITIYPEIEETMLTTGLFPYISKLYLSVQGRGVTDDTKNSILSLFASVASNSAKFREVISSSGGQQLARMYKFPELLKGTDSKS